MDALSFLQDNNSGSDAVSFLNQKERSLKDKILDLLTMGHVGGEYGPESEVKFTPEGKMSKSSVPTADPGFFQDPVTALAMGGVAGVRAAAGPLGKLAAGGREALGWLTGGGSEIPSLAKAGVKGAAKSVESKNLAKLSERRQENGVLESITPEAKVSSDVVDDALKPIVEATPKAAVKAEDYLQGEIIQPGATSQATAAKPAKTMDLSSTTATFDNLIPEVKGGATGELPKYAEGSSINLEKLNTTDDVKQFLNARTTEIEDKIGKRNVSWDETRLAAEELGWNQKAVKKAWESDKGITAAKIDAARQINLNAITDLHNAIKDIPYDQTTLTPELRAKVLDAMDTIKTTSQMSSEAGRALNIHKRVLENDPDFQVKSNMARVLKAIDGKGGKRTDELINSLKDIDFSDPAQVNRFVYNATKTKIEKLSDGAFELWINGLLSNPLTHIVNTTSNALTLAYGANERLLAAGVDAARSLVTGKPREIFFKEGAEDILSIAGGLQSGVSRFANAMKKGDSLSKIDAPVSALPDSVAKYLPTRALAAEDAFFKGFIEHSEINRLAYRQARSEKLTGQELQDRIVELATTPTEDMLEAAAKRGQYLTYQKELGEVGKLVMKARDTVPGLKYFIPFVKTPLNIAKFAIERTPLNLPVVIAKAARGELKGGALSEELAKPLMGSLFGYTAYQLAEQGRITGGGPKDKEEREALQNTGWQPYSYKTQDGKYISFARFEPMSSILGMAADMSEMKHKMSEDEKYNLAAGVMGSISNNISNKTFMQGFSNLINAMSDPGRYGKNVVKQLTGSVVPAVSAGIVRSVDDNVRDTSTVMNNIQSRIPGLSQGLPEKLNVWGESITRPGNAVGRFISPMQVSEAKGTPLENEVARLKLNIGLPTKDINGAKLSENEYWNLVKNSGQPASEQLNRIVSSPQWNNIDDEIKKKIIRGMIERYHEAGREKLKAMLINNGRLINHNGTFKAVNE